MPEIVVIRAPFATIGGQPGFSEVNRWSSNHQPINTARPTRTAAPAIKRVYWRHACRNPAGLRDPRVARAVRFGSSAEHTTCLPFLCPGVRLASVSHDTVRQARRGSVAGPNATPRFRHSTSPLNGSEDGTDRLIKCGSNLARSSPSRSTAASSASAASAQPRVFLPRFSPFASVPW
jgi:hypothetical protein